MLVARFLVGFGSGISKYLSLSLLLFVISFFSLINVFNTHMFIGCVSRCVEPIVLRILILETRYANNTSPAAYPPRFSSPPLLTHQA